MLVRLNLFFFFFSFNIWAADNCVPVDRIYQNYRRIQGELATTRTGLQGDLFYDHGEISFTTSDGHRGDILGLYKDGELNILGSDVAEAIRGERVQNLMFDRLIEITRRRGPITRINMRTTMVDDNKRAFLVALARRLNIRFNPNFSGLQLEDLLLRNHMDDVERILADQSQLELILFETPAWRTRSRYGFPRICPDGNRININAYSISVQVDACPP